MATSVLNYGVLPHRPAVPWAAAGLANGFPVLDDNQAIRTENLPEIPAEKLPVIPTSKLPDSILSGLTYEGVWDATTLTAGSPALGQLVFSTGMTTMANMGVLNTPVKGQYWRVSVGTTGDYPEPLTGSPTDFAMGDYLVVESVTEDSGNYTLTFSKVDNSETVTGVTLDGTLETGTVTLDGAIGATQLKDNSIGVEKMKYGSVGTATLQDNSVSTAKLAAQSVTASEIALGVVDNTHIASDSIAEMQIVDNAVTSTKIDGGAIQTHHIGANQLNVAHLPTSWDGLGRTMTWYADSSVPVTQLSVVEDEMYPNNSVNYPKASMIFDSSIGQNGFELRRQNCEGPITLDITQTITVPDNFAGFKSNYGKLNLSVLADIFNDGGVTHFTIQDVYGFESGAVQREPSIPPMQSSPTNRYEATPFPQFNEPLDSAGNVLKPGQSFVVHMVMTLAGVGGVNQRACYRGLKFDYLYQV